MGKNLTGSTHGVGRRRHALRSGLGWPHPSPTLDATVGDRPEIGLIRSIRTSLPIPMHPKLLPLFYRSSDGDDGAKCIAWHAPQHAALPCAILMLLACRGELGADQFANDAARNDEAEAGALDSADIDADHIAILVENGTAAHAGIDVTVDDIDRRPGTGLDRLRTGEIAIRGDAGQIEGIALEGQRLMRFQITA